MNIPASWLLTLIIAAVSASGGFWLSHTISAKQIASMALESSTKVIAATEARDKAESKYKLLKEAADKSQAEALAKYNEGVLDGKASSIRIIDDLRNDVTRLRVSVAKGNSSSGSMSVPSSNSKGGDEEVGYSLSPTVAARLAGRYANYNEVVTQLTLCQDILVVHEKMSSDK